MEQEEQKYLETGRAISGAIESQMFAKPCFKINGKAFISFSNNSMVFKLYGVFTPLPFVYRELNYLILPGKTDK